MSRELAAALRVAFEQWTGVILPPAQLDSALAVLGELASHRASSPGDCLTAMQRDRGLRQDLIDSVNLGLTWFMRDQDGLVELARDIAAAHAQDPERVAWVWSIGCSTGEEPYSLAMLLAEHGIVARILATDINRRALRHALDGVYPERSMARVPPAMRARYFESAGPGRVRARPNIRRLVTFELHNIAESQQPPRGWTQFDGVVCRNVLMFLDRRRAISVIAGITATCRPGGYMIVGSIERPLLWLTHQLDALDESAPIVHVPRETRRRLQTVPLSRSQIRAPSVVPDRRAATVDSRAPADGALAEVAGAYRLVQQGALERALDILEDQTERHPLLAVVQLARGLALKQSGMLREAVTAFRAARFLEGNAWFAPYQLGLCLEALGDPDDACEAYRHAITVVDGGGPSGLSSLDHDAETLRLTVAAACRTRLQSLSRHTVT